MLTPTAQYSRTTIRNYLSRYTLLFLITWTLSFGFFFLLLRRSFMWTVDAFEQHYPAFIYIGRLGRSFLRNLFLNHRFVFRMWENGIGYGGDVVTTFTTYLYDPFNWISVLFPSACSEIAYNLMILLKLWCCGLSFSYYALCRGNSENSALAGAVTYALCSVVFISFFSHNFVNPMLIFPLLITGADRLFTREHSVLYVFSLFWAFASYFYFAYMMCLLLVVYCILKLAFASGISKTPADVLRLVARFFVHSVLSAALAAFTLLPTLLLLSRMNRLRLEHYLPLFYTKSFYGSLFAGFTDAELMMGRDCMLGFGSFSLFCVFVLFLHRNFQSQLKAEFLLATCGLCLPFVGHVMNGFSYMANRWVWAYALIVSEIVAVSVPLIRNLTRKKCFAVLSASLLYVLILFVFFKRTGLRNLFAAGLLLTLAVLSFYVRKISENRYQKAVAGALIVCLAVPGYFWFFPGGSFIVRQARKFGTSYPAIVTASGKPVLDLLDTSVPLRSEISIPDAPRNASWISETSSMDFYISMYNGNIDRFHDRIGLHTYFMNFCYRGLQRRSELSALMGTGRCIVAGEPSTAVPYGYTQLELSARSDTRIYHSLRRKENASLFYLFDHGVPAESAEALSPEEYQQLIMKACVVPTEAADRDLQEIALSDDEIAAELHPQDGIQWVPDENTFHVSKGNSELILTFDEIRDSELYLFLDDVSFVSGQEQYFPLSAGAYMDGQPLPGLTGAMEGSTYYSHLYGGKKQWLIHLGYTGQPADSLHLCFAKPGLYHIGKISVYARKKQDLDATHLLLDSPVRNASYETNHFSCDVTAALPQYLFMSIPGPDGWTCYDNGKEIPLIPTDEAFMSVRLSPGEHHIDLHYRTPGLVPGGLVSLMAFLLTLCFFRKKHSIPANLFSAKNV